MCFPKVTIVAPIHIADLLDTPGMALGLFGSVAERRPEPALGLDWAGAEVDVASCLPADCDGGQAHHVSLHHAPCLSQRLSQRLCTRVYVQTRAR